MDWTGRGCGGPGWHGLCLTRVTGVVLDQGGLQDSRSLNPMLVVGSHHQLYQPKTNLEGQTYSKHALRYWSTEFLSEGIDDPGSLKTIFSSYWRYLIISWYVDIQNHFKRGTQKKKNCYKGDDLENSGFFKTLLSYTGSTIK